MSAVRKQFAIIVCVTTSRLNAKMSIRLKEHVIGKPLQQKKNEQDKLQHLSRELNTT